MNDNFLISEILNCISEKLVIISNTKNYFSMHNLHYEQTDRQDRQEDLKNINASLEIA